MLKIKKGNAMIDKKELEALKELQDLQKQELISSVKAKLPEYLEKISQGLTYSELKKFKELKIVNLKEKEDKKGNKVLLSNEEIIYEVVIPLLEMRGAKDSEMDNLSVSDLLTFYSKVEALTSNPRIVDIVEKKN